MVADLALYQMLMSYQAVFIDGVLSSFIRVFQEPEWLTVLSEPRMFFVLVLIENYLESRCFTTFQILKPLKLARGLSYA